MRFGIFAVPIQMPNRPLAVVDRNQTRCGAAAAKRTLITCLLQLRVAAGLTSLATCLPSFQEPFKVLCNLRAQQFGTTVSFSD